MEERRKLRRLTPWLRQHHDELAAIFDGQRITWAPILETVRRLQLVDARGKAPSVDTLAKAWRRVHEQATRREAQRAQASHDPAILAAGVRVLTSSYSGPAQPRADDRALTGLAGHSVAVPSPVATQAATIVPPQSAQEGMSDVVRHARDRVVWRTSPLPT